jgi:hypothetical protein
LDEFTEDAAMIDHDYNAHSNERAKSIWRSLKELARPAAAKPVDPNVEMEAIIEAQQKIGAQDANK